MIYIVAPIFALGLAIGIQAICCRNYKKNSLYGFLFGGIIVGIILSFTFIHYYGFSIESFSAILFFAFLSELYIFLFTLVSSSVSVSLIIHLINGALEEKKVLQIYDSRQMVVARLIRMQAVGLIYESSPEVFLLTEKGVRLRSIFVHLRSFFRFY